MRVGIRRKPLRVFRETGQITDARIQRGSPIAHHYQFRAGPGDCNIEQIPVTLQEAQRALACSHGYDGREDDDVALVALKSVNGIDHELERGKMAREFVVLMHERPYPVCVRPEWSHYS